MLLIAGRLFAQRRVKSAGGGQSGIGWEDRALKAIITTTLNLLMLNGFVILAIKLLRPERAANEITQPNLQWQKSWP